MIYELMAKAENDNPSHQLKALFKREGEWHG